MNQRLVGILSGIKVIKAFKGEEMENRVFAEETDKLFRRVMKVVKNRVLSRTVVEMLNTGMGVGVLLLATVLVLQNRWGLTAGDVAAFTTALATTYKPVKTLSKGWAKLMDALSLGRALLRSPRCSDRAARRAQRGRDHPDSIRGSDVDLRDLQLRPRGGPSGRQPRSARQRGGGDRRPDRIRKDRTLMDLLLRFADPDAGSIQLDGVDIREITRDSFISQIAVVTQDPFLFDTSIRENIRYGRPDATENEMLTAAHAAHVDEFVDQLPDGYETAVGEFGTLLSGGQRQRITIARAILRTRRFWSSTKRRARSTRRPRRPCKTLIDTLRGDRTVFVIAHRLSTIRNAATGSW